MCLCSFCVVYCVACIWVVFKYVECLCMECVCVWNVCICVYSVHVCSVCDWCLVYGMYMCVECCVDVCMMYGVCMCMWYGGRVSVCAVCVLSVHDEQACGDQRQTSVGSPPGPLSILWF